MNENVFTIKAAIVAFFTTLGAFFGWRGIMLLAWLGVMILDYITGTAAACKDGKWSSKIARQGLWHKGGMIIVILVAALADVVMVVIAEKIPIGIEWPGLIMPIVLAWYIVTEMGSILENALKLGAPVPAWLVKMLEASANIIENVGGQTLPPMQHADDPEDDKYQDALIAEAVSGHRGEKE